MRIFILVSFLCLTLVFADKQVKLSEGTLIVSSSSDSSYGKTSDFTDESPIQTQLELEPKQHLFINYKVKNVATKRPVSVHQSIIQFTNTETKRSTYFVATYKSSQYEFHLDVSKEGKKFNYVSGNYSVSIILGDASIDNSLIVNVAHFKSITFDGKPTDRPSLEDRYKPKPEITHIFRAPSKRAPEFTTNIFNILVVVPLLIFVAGIFRSGANFSNYPTAGLTPIYALLFLGGLGLLLGMIVIYWLQLRLFTALFYMSVITLPTVVFGNKVLRYYASQRLTKTN